MHSGFSVPCGHISGASLAYCISVRKLLPVTSTVNVNIKSPNLVAMAGNFSEKTFDYPLNE